MGNCLFGGLGDPDDDDDDNDNGVIKVTTSNGGIMEFSPPITAGSITSEFPGHAIFPSQDLFWNPVFHQENLLPGKSYYLLPLNDNINGAAVTVDTNQKQNIVKQGHIRANSIPASLVAPPYRMSFDYHQGMLKRSYTDVFSSSRYNNNNNNKNKKQRYWKVKLVISPEQLLEILSQENRTEELIESVRTVAKCGGTNSGMSPPMTMGFSDQWSLSSSSRNASSKKDSLLDF